MIAFLTLVIVGLVILAAVLGWKLEQAQRWIEKREHYIGELTATLRHHHSDWSHHHRHGGAS